MADNAVEKLGLMYLRFKSGKEILLDDIFKSYNHYPAGDDISQTTTIVGLSYHFDYVELELSAHRPNRDITLSSILSKLTNIQIG